MCPDYAGAINLVPMLSFPSDSSLTCSNVQAALRTVDERTLERNILWMSRTRQKLCVDDNYRDQLITHYLQSSPFASWEWIAGMLLCHKEGVALEEVRKFLQPEEGEYSESCLSLHVMVTLGPGRVCYKVH